MPMSTVLCAYSEIKCQQLHGYSQACCILHDHQTVTAKWCASWVDISRQRRQFDVGLQRTEVQKIHTNSQYRRAIRLLA